VENLTDKIQAIIEERFKEPDLEDCFLVEMILNNTKLEIYIDTDEGVSFKKCQKLSRAVEAYLDESLAMGEKYTLEVSSPGIGRPLKFKRQYPRNIGRKIKLKLKDGSKVEGKFIAMENDILTIESKGQKKKEVIKNEIEFESIESSKILITF
jgi:ribosome maturation factor RimP